jgi:hypothetical protein
VKAAALPLSLILVLAVFAAPVVAQAEPVTETTCLRLTSETPLESVEPAALGQLLIEGAVAVEVLADEACAADGTASSEPAARGTSHVRFIAFGAGAAVELVGLAKRHEGADTIVEIDTAARAIAAWAKHQRKWLDKHPPQACYQAEHKQWRTGVVQVRRAAKSVREALRTLKPRPMRQAVRQLSAGADNLSSVDLGAVRERCMRAG